MKKSIGEIFKVLRVERGLSQGDIHKRTGLLRSYLSRVENGHTTPSLETLEKMAQALGLDLAELFVLAGGKPSVHERKTSAARQDAQFWNQMRRYTPLLEDFDRKLLLSLARKMAAKD